MRTGRREQAAPTEACLKNRPVGADPDTVVTVHEETRGYLQPAPRVLAARIGDRLHVVDAHGAAIRLRDTALSFWEAATSGPSQNVAVERLGDRYASTPAVLHDDVTAFDVALQKRSLLVSRAEGG